MDKMLNIDSLIVFLETSKDGIVPILCYPDILEEFIKYRRTCFTCIYYTAVCQKLKIRKDNRVFGQLEKIVANIEESQKNILKLVSTYNKLKKSIKLHNIGYQNLQDAPPSSHTHTTNRVRNIIDETVYKLKEVAQQKRAAFKELLDIVVVDLAKNPIKIDSINTIYFPKKIIINASLHERYELKGKYNSDVYINEELLLTDTIDNIISCASLKNEYETNMFFNIPYTFLSSFLKSIKTGKPFDTFRKQSEEEYLAMYSIRGVLDLYKLSINNRGTLSRSKDSLIFLMTQIFFFTVVVGREDAIIYKYIYNLLGYMYTRIMAYMPSKMRYDLTYQMIENPNNKCQLMIQKISNLLSYGHLLEHFEYPPFWNDGII